MNTVLIWAMAVTAFIFTIMGGVLLAVLLFYGMYRLIASIWERTSLYAYWIGPGMRAWTWTLSSERR